MQGWGALNLRKYVKAGGTSLWRFLHSTAIFKATHMSRHEGWKRRKAQELDKEFERFTSILFLNKLTSVHTSVADKTLHNIRKRLRCKTWAFCLGCLLSY